MFKKEVIIMDNIFNILDRELVYSDEKLNYVRLKWEYQRKAYEAEKNLKSVFPKAKNRDSLLGQAFLNELSDLGPGLTSEIKTEFSLGIKKDLGIYSAFVKMRQPYMNAYIGALDSIAESLTNELGEQRVYIDKDEILACIVSDSTLTKRLAEVAESYRLKSEGYSRKYSELIDNVEHNINIEMHSQSGKLQGLIYENIVLPLSVCLIERMKNDEELGGAVEFTTRNEVSVVRITEKPMNVIGKRMFSDAKIQNAFFESISDDVFLCFRLKLRLFSENNLCGYEPSTSDEVNRASSLYKLIDSRDIPEDDEKEMMAEMLQLDPFQSMYYKIIIDKYFDENGEIQRLAKETTVDLTTHIENYLMKIYNDGNIGTLESTLALKDEILEAERKFHYKDSKAFKSALFRQHFLELSRQASEMSIEEIVETWQSIKNSNNIFAVGERADVDDDSCILILTRRFLRLHAAEYHDLIRGLGLVDDATEGDKNYAFYEEGEDYLTFEENVAKIEGVKFERDDDLSVQNYSDEKLASGEVILGFFHYTRAMDIIGDGKVLLITNKRIYTTKEKFTDFSCISECKPIKKLMLTYLTFEKNDGKTIQLPVSKELMLPAADMINRLIAALKGTEYIANSVEVSDSKGMAAAKTTVSNTVNSLKKGFGSLFGKSKNKTNAWSCTCGSSNEGAFCPNCGAKRPE